MFAAYCNWKIGAVSVVADVVVSGEENFLILSFYSCVVVDCIILLFIPVLSKRVEILPEILLQLKWKFYSNAVV